MSKRSSCDTATSDDAEKQRLFKKFKHVDTSKSKITKHVGNDHTRRIGSLSPREKLPSENKFLKGKSLTLTPFLRKNDEITPTSNLPDPAVDTQTLRNFEPLMNMIDKIAGGQRVPPEITMQYEMLRVFTLRSYPKDNKPYITRIAQAGFYYANKGDELVCYCCEQKRSNWTETDIPIEVHKKMNKNCRFITHNSEVNVPIKDNMIEGTPMMKPQNEPLGSNTGTPRTSVSTRIIGQLLTPTDSSKNAQQASTVSATCSTHDNCEEVNTPVYFTDENTRIHEVPLPSVDNTVIKKFEPLIKIIDKIADGEIVPPHISMQYEMLRFCTLRSFPKVNKPYITRLAQAGFYYANREDEVICYCCHQRKSNWNESDIPMDVHRDMNSNCMFLTRNSEVNVPVQHAFQGAQQTTSPFPAMNAFYLEHTRRSVATVRPGCNDTIESPNKVHAQRDSANSFSGSQQTTPIHKSLDEQVNSPDESPMKTAKYPKYANKKNRITSFNGCAEIVISPDSLAEAGFFYTGVADCVRCFQCGVGLRNWSQEDDPWIEHSKWSRDCSFVKQMRGQELINLVQMAHGEHGNQGNNATGQFQLWEQKIEENEKLKQQSICTKCKKNDACMMFIPCGHMVTCQDCAPTVRYCTVATCGKIIAGNAHIVMFNIKS